jgi:sirohydrochlorin cobaltochelatase
MKRRTGMIFLALSVMLAAIAGPASASGKAVQAAEKNAIVLAAFGTTVPGGVVSITNIIDMIRNEYPDTEVRLTFTSNMIRSVWKKRRAEAQKWLDQGIPEEVLYVKNIITTIGELREDGYRNIVVQPAHMFFMEQSHDLRQYVNGLASIRTMKRKWRPFDNLVMGRPALGMPGDKYDYHADVEAAVATLAGDVAQAREAGAMLIYMGHGNEHWSTGIYTEVQNKLRDMYPDVASFVGVVEGYPGLDDLQSHLEKEQTRKVILKPFMIVAGDHAKNDMAGPEEDSWKSILTGQGYEVEAVLEGLGSNDRFARLFVDHIADAARERGLVLK